MDNDNRPPAARARNKVAVSRVGRGRLRLGESPRYVAWLARFRLNRAIRAREMEKAQLDAACHPAEGMPSASDAIDQSVGGVASQRLVLLAREIGPQAQISIGAVVDQLGSSSLGLILLILTIPAIIPIPGPIGIILGSCLALVALQVVVGAKRVWLPGWLRSCNLPTRFVTAAIARIVPWLERFERRLSPRRWMMLSGRVARPFLGLAILAMAVIITLPIPFGNILPVVALAMLALALLERDGVAVLVALGMSLVAIICTGMLLLFGVQALEALWRLFG